MKSDVVVLLPQVVNKMLFQQVLSLFNKTNGEKLFAKQHIG